LTWTASAGHRRFPPVISKDETRALRPGNTTAGSAHRSTYPSGRQHNPNEDATRQGGGCAELTPVYVRRLMGTLHSAGLVVGIFGGQGGPRLALPTQSIAVGEALHAMEGHHRSARLQDGSYCHQLAGRAAPHLPLECPELSPRLLRTDDHDRAGLSGRERKV